jgi:hypothetical protein
MIYDRLGQEAALVFSEAVANVREHSAEHRAEMSLHKTGFYISNGTNGHFSAQTVKPEGEGGYGLRIINMLGACVDCEGDTTSIRWQKHS